jgi:hypothetical protein
MSINDADPIILSEHRAQSFYSNNFISIERLSDGILAPRPVGSASNPTV